jgi:hypothetical protein
MQTLAKDRCFLLQNYGNPGEADSRRTSVAATTGYHQRRIGGVRWQHPGAALGRVVMQAKLVMPGKAGVS